MDRFIFDLDGTLLFGNFNEENEYFKDVLKTDADIFLENLLDNLYLYEATHIKYKVDDLARFLSNKTNLEITEQIILGWLDVNSNIKDTVEECAFETLEYLKSKDKSIVVLTNWFGMSQIKRLENAKILPYLDAVYSGDMYLKPHKYSYINARGDYDINKCIVIGDTYEKDYLGPRKVGMNSCFYNRNSDKESNEVIKSLRKIKEMY